MLPNTIHKNTTGPNTAPISAPKIGPVPAMFSNWIRNTFQVGISTKSTPSASATAGVGRSSGPKMCSTSLLYTR